MRQREETGLREDREEEMEGDEEDEPEAVSDLIHRVRMHTHT